jgi:hypothetical protein
MKNKFFAIAAASTAALTAAIISAPAQAQITGTTPQSIGLTIGIPEVLLLRTVQNISVNLTPADLGANNLTAAGSGYVGSEVANTTATSANTGGVSLLTPFTAAAGTINKSVPQVYAVFSNSPRNQVKVTMAVSSPNLTNTSGGTGKITGVTTTLNGTTGTSVTTTAPGLSTPAFGPANLALSLTGNQSAGSYTGGVITVQAEAP